MAGGTPSSCLSTPGSSRMRGGELVSLSFNIDLVRHGPSHLLVFKSELAALEQRASGLIRLRVSE
jgi:hypothetical protein